MLCSDFFLNWTHKCKFVNENLERGKASTPQFPISKELRLAGGDMCLNVLAPGRYKVSLKITLVSISPNILILSPHSSQKSKHSWVEATGKCSRGRGCRGERRQRGYDEGILILRSDEKGRRSLCPA